TGAGAGTAAGAAAGRGGVGVLAGPVRNVVFACDAGMGSSAMGASVLRNKIKAAGFPEVNVSNASIANLSDTYDVVVTHQDLTERAKPATSSAVHVSVDNFMNSPRYDEIVELVERSNAEGTAAPAATATAAAPAATTPETAAAPATGAAPSDILVPESVVLTGSASTRDAAIDEAGRLLLERGAVDEDYIRAMHEREESVSTYMGSFLAIPHGTNAAKDHIRKSAVSVVRYPDGIDWNGKQVKFVVGVAGVNNEHLHILSSIAKVFTNKAQVAQLEAATTVDEVLELFGKVNA
ncbi:MAG TPA: PTS sugar transporter subunit IIA, partial [Arthrobacter sp.]|nr:PTS sugar transporter subunit IIA [Arthrobacter sp.]